MDESILLCLREVLLFGQHIRENINRKKNFYFQALPESPNLGSLVLSFFGRQKRRFAGMTVKNSDDDKDSCNDNYYDNDGNFDDNDEKNDLK